MKRIVILTVFMLTVTVLLYGQNPAPRVADTGAYLSGIKKALTIPWPHNHTINLVFHGHSVPSGYRDKHEVHTLEAYPQLVLRALKEKYPYAVINIIVTAIGGENSVSGEARFEKDVLPYRPDVLFIDYALNDRRIGLEKTKQAMEKMIKMALKKHIRIILVTPSPDLKVDITVPGNILEQYTNQLIALAQQYHIGLANSYAAFVNLAKSGEDLHKYMAQYNHPNGKGHAIIANEIMKWFE